MYRKGATPLKIDLGDLDLELNLRLKGTRPRRALKFGAPRKTTPADRVPSVPQAYRPSSGEVRIIMNLQSDKQVAILGLVDVDEMGNEIGASAEQATYTTDDAAGEFIVLTDNGDGTGNIAATGEIGSAQVTATFTDGTTLVESVNVVTGDVASRSFKFGEPTEVTPDV
jgi:hypothetical protein